MPKVIDWDNFDTDNLKSSGNGGSRRKFFKFNDGTIVRCRPIGNGIAFTKFYNRKTRRSICVETEDAIAIAKYIAEKTGLEIQPQERFAINAIDRSDGEIKILEGSYSIFKCFGAWSKEMSKEKNEKIGVGHSVYGGNWTIKAEGDGKARRYTTTFIGTCPITKEEREMIDRMKNELKLNDTFKTCPKDKIIPWLFGDGDTLTEDDHVDNNEIEHDVENNENSPFSKNLVASTVSNSTKDSRDEEDYQF